MHVLDPDRLFAAALELGQHFHSKGGGACRQGGTGWQGENADAAEGRALKAAERRVGRDGEGY